jgi:hypothetical protein
VPAVRGRIEKVKHLIRVEAVDEPAKAGRGKG